MTVPETVSSALRDAALALSGVTPAPRLEAEWLMAHALGCSRSNLLLRHMGDPAPTGFAPLLARRAAGEPIAHVTGKTEFYGLRLRVTRDVLVPRSDTELLVDLARQHFADHPPKRILDCGTGSGAMLLAALSVWPNAQGTGLERSAPALDIAKTNATDLGIGDRADMRAGDWTVPDWSDGLGQFDLVLSNPPYVATHDPDLAADVAASDPHEALFAGEDGLADYRILIPALPRLLAPRGLAIFEIGSRQAPAVMAMARESGLRATAHDDLAHRPRAVAMWHETGDDR
ncbi:MAG: protein-(glutamine-N5) methyltransferase, release factor-specific [Croceicoccus sp.]|nr:protein-(glutamine-N5) methyltransferase, release factor-specific [Croceicoccus sp.]MAL27608.1 protein-(glutamine-N5) methyltransferase, release factor-specific [Croceicoccus sp.]|tara:strand:+ start:4289 stop:5152 length:864 start_codon:yes stop_codon:yes gene_type:complete